MQEILSSPQCDNTVNFLHNTDHIYHTARTLVSPKRNYALVL